MDEGTQEEPRQRPQPSNRWGYGSGSTFSVGISKEHSLALKKLAQEKEAEQCELCGRSDKVTLKSLVAEMIEEGLKKYD